MPMMLHYGMTNELLGLLFQEYFIVHVLHLGINTYYVVCCKTQRADLHCTIRSPERENTGEQVLTTV